MANATILRTANFYQLMWHLAHYSHLGGDGPRARFISQIDDAATSRLVPARCGDATEFMLQCLAAEWRYAGSFFADPADTSSGRLRALPQIVRQVCVRNACPCPHRIVEHCIIRNDQTGITEWIGNECIRWFTSAGHALDTHGVASFISAVKRDIQTGMSGPAARMLYSQAFITADERDFCISTYQKKKANIDLHERERINRKAMKAMGYRIDAST